MIEIGCEYLIKCKIMDIINGKTLSEYTFIKDAKDVIDEKNDKDLKSHDNYEVLEVRKRYYYSVDGQKVIYAASIKELNAKIDAYRPSKNESQNHKM